MTKTWKFSANNISQPHGRNGMTPLQGTSGTIARGITRRQFLKALESSWPGISGPGGGFAPTIGTCRDVNGVKNSNLIQDQGLL